MRVDARERHSEYSRVVHGLVAPHWRRGSGVNVRVPLPSYPTISQTILNERPHSLADWLSVNLMGFVDPLTGGTRNPGQKTLPPNSGNLVFGVHPASP
jgi:hypothetical protein